MAYNNGIGGDDTTTATTRNHCEQLVAVRFAYAVPEMLTRTK